MARKMSLWVTIAPFLCSFCIIGSGFALWQFNDVLETTDTVSASVQVAAMSEEGELSIRENSYFPEFRLILEQTEREFAQSEDGVYLVPSIALEYSNFLIADTITATLTGTVTINNLGLESYIELKNCEPVEITTSTKAIEYVFLNEEISLVNDVEYTKEVIPPFGYKKGMEPHTTEQYSTMITTINSGRINLPDVVIEFSITFTEEG